MFKLIFMSIFLIKIYTSVNQECAEVFFNGNVKNLNLKFIENCLPSLLDLDEIDENVANNIWEIIKDSSDGVENISTNFYKYMGKVLSKIPIEDFMNITIDELEMVQTFGKMESLNEDKMKLIAKKVSTEWTNKTPEKYSEYDLISLGRILCYLNKTEISKIHPDAYKYAAKRIGELTCPQETLNELAKLAVNYDAFGPPNKWSKLDVLLIGNVIKGLNQFDYSSINPEILKVNQKLVNVNNKNVSKKN